MSAEGASEVISQVAPTVWIRLPKLDTRLAIHRARKMRERNGERAEVAGAACGSLVLGCANLESDIQPLLPAAEARPDLGRADIHGDARRPLLNAEEHEPVQPSVSRRGTRGPKLEHNEAATRKRHRSSANLSVAHPMSARTSFRDGSLTRQKALGEGAVRGRAELNPEQAVTLHNTPKCYLRCYLEADCAEDQIS